MKNSELKVVYRAVDDLIPYARNSRTHSAEQIAQIAASIKEFGFTSPVLTDGENVILAGHGRVEAARKAGLTSVPCIDLSHLSEAQRRAYVIADNRIALNAGWDDEMLKVELAELAESDFDLSLLGFETSELSGLLGDTGDDGDSDGGDESGGIDYQEKYAVVIECEGEAHQIEVYEKLVAEGYSCKVLVN